MNKMIKILCASMVIISTLQMHAGGMGKKRRPRSPQGVSIGLCSPWDGQRWRSMLNAHIMSGLDFAVEAILKQKVIDINAKDPNGDTPMDLALKYNRPEIVKLLKRYGAVTQLQPLTEDDDMITWYDENDN